MALLAAALLAAATASPHAGSKPHLVFLLQDVRTLRLLSDTELTSTPRHYSHCSVCLRLPAAMARAAGSGAL